MAKQPGQYGQNAIWVSGLSKEGRTANQYKKWLEKRGDEPKNIFGSRR